MQANHRKYTLSELTQGLDVKLKGDPQCIITGIGPIQQAQSGQITFLTNPLYKKYLETTAASAVILKEEEAVDCPVNAIISPNPYYTYAQIATLFSEQAQTPTPGIHTSAVIGEGSDIHASVTISPYCVIGKDVKIAENVYIGPGCFVGDGTVIGADSRLDAHVTLYHKVKIGKRVRIASGVVIGADGFGFANNKGAWYKVPQLGSVTIGDDVDIGANTTIDRGAVEDTIIENGVKMDNLMQIGHNVRIGANTIMAGCTGVAGSTVIGKNCMIGGGSCINGHITITDGVMLTGMSAVTKSILQPGLYSSGVVGVVPNEEFRKNNARFNRLGNLMDRVKSLESRLKELIERVK